MTPAAWCAGLLAGVATVVGSVRGAARSPTRRGGTLVRPSSTKPGRRPAARAVAVLAGFTVVAVLGFPVGIPVAVLVVVLVPRALSRLEPAALRRERARELRDVPLTAELLAAALAAGCPLRDAIAVTVEVLDGRLAARLALALGELRLGGASESAWLPAFASAPESVREVAAVLGEAELRGIAPIPQLRALAERQRRAAATGAAAHAHRVGVWSVGPLGLCFLPAFVLVGVLPLVAAAVHLLKF